MLVVLIGPPGAGKSSQAKLLEAREHVEWVYVGQLLRDQHRADIDAQLVKGELVDDMIVNNLLTEHLTQLSPDKVVVLDGFPRHLPQAEWLLREAGKLHNGLKLVIHLTIPEEEAQRRLRTRGRTDDTADTINDRWHDYRTQVLPVVDHFAKIGVPVKAIDGNRPIEQVFQEIDEALLNVHQSQNA